MLKIVVSISEVPEQQMFMAQLIDDALYVGGFDAHLVVTNTSKVLELDIGLFISLAEKILAKPQNHKAFFFGDSTYNKELQKDLATLKQLEAYVGIVSVEHKYKW